MHTLPNFPDSTAREIYARLCRTLELLPTDTPEARAARDDDAMNAVAALHPTDAMEARLAADIVGLEAYATDSLRLAGEYRGDLAATTRCRAQATSMFRQMRCLLRDYQRMQAERDKALLEMHPAAMERSGYWFRESVVPGPAPEPAPEPAPPPPAAPPSAAPAKPRFEDLTAVEQFAIMYPARAAQIRAEGGLPKRLDYGPPDPEIVEGLVHGDSPILRALDAPPLAVAAE
ncbi:MAG TPA: hypothetical protein VKI44_24365 [Acetobacteraceae bacterium]|nr:hypothetical protein [Acetobacteraceae bacterium]